MTEEKHNLPEEVPQVDKFRDLARDLECDEDEERFEEALKKVAKALKAAPPEKATS